MRFKTYVLLSGAFLVLGLSVFPVFAQAQTQIARSGSTVVAAVFSTGKVTATIHTIKLEGDCAKACPASRPVTEWGPTGATVIQNMEISVDGHPVIVPPSVYASFSEPLKASLSFEDGNFVLRIDGGDGALSYFVRIYFDRKEINREMSYASAFPDQPTEDSHYYHNADRGE